MQAQKNTPRERGVFGCGEAVDLAKEGGGGAGSEGGAYLLYYIPPPTPSHAYTFFEEGAALAREGEIYSIHLISKGAWAPFGTPKRQ